jgi:hypothetical protein
MPDLNSSQMKKIVSEGKSGVTLPNGKIVTEAKDVPSDKELGEMREANRKAFAEKIERRKASLVA